VLIDIVRERKKEQSSRNFGKWLEVGVIFECLMTRAHIPTSLEFRGQGMILATGGNHSLWALASISSFAWNYLGSIIV